jgi:hypothetical protein
MSPRAAQLTLLAVGAAHVGAGVVMLFAPGPFYDGLATFPPRNDHFTRDLATFYVALGVGFAIAAGRPGWRAPVLVVAGIEYALHLANHLYDLGYPDVAWVGPVTTALLAGALGLLAVLAFALFRRPREDGRSRARVTR